MTTKRGYARRHLGGGNALKAVTRVKRANAGRSLGRAPGKMPGPAVYRAYERKLAEELLATTEDLLDVAEEETC